ncbi:uncharacterized protein LOC133206174 [Saccostrea echinata]|uniref:uncharacterized protein LOC133206174 n=1 Tax=Saccostrea echinata TaxID=191078 RepID=UPI002A80963D|nr:uncharacterized protein LOC133206174 [Saccostrea echinata]
MSLIAITVIFSLIASTLQVSWPRGTYTLVKPRSGCPRGWLEGWRYQDNEDKHNTNFITPGHHFAGGFDKNMRFQYCTKNQHQFSNRRYWPRGNYCILKHGHSCPRYFRQGSVYWDDEDNSNKNAHGGTLPSGSYDRNTRIDYCCRKDGSYRSKMSLPTSKPFYLLRFRAHCQRVSGMHVREETVKSDDEDTRNKNLVRGWYPLGAGGRNHVLQYCYYWR